MKFYNKNIIFTLLSEASYATLTNKIKTFREALYWHLPFGVGTLGEMFLQGLFICSCLKTPHSKNTYSDQDKGACNSCTLIQKIIGSCKSGRHGLGGNSDHLFVGAFSLFLLCFCVVGSAFPFWFFSFKIFTS